MKFDSIRQWSLRSLANSLLLQVAFIVLITVLVVSGVSLGILFLLEKEAIEAELRHDSEAAARRIEEPLLVMEDALAELAKSTMLMTALLDSGGRAIYVRPYLQNYAFPVSAPNGMALCDSNGVRLAGTRNMSQCNADSPQFKQVIADGITRRTLGYDSKGDRVWTIYKGVTFAYTGTTEGVAVAQINLDHMLHRLQSLLNAEEIDFRVSDGHSARSLRGGFPGALLESKRVVSLFDGKAMLGSEHVEIVIAAGHSRARGVFLPLLAGYLIATIALMIVILFWVRRRSKQLTSPLIALRDRAQEIASTGDLSLAIPRSGIDEVGQLAESIDEMIGAIHRAETTRRVAEEWFRLIFEKSGEAIMFGWPDGRLELANPEALRLFGYNEITVQGVGRQKFVDEYDPRVRAAMEIRSRTGVFRGELPFRSADGRQMLSEVVSTLFKDSRGEIRTSIFVRDISERKQAEQALKDSKELLSTVLDSLDEMVVVLNKVGMVVSVNESWKRFGQDNDVMPSIVDAVGLDYLSFCDEMHKNDMPTEVRLVKEGIRAVLSKQQARFDIVLPPRSFGEKRWFTMRVTPIEGARGGAVIVYDEITERKLVEIERVEHGNRLAELSRHIVAVQEDSLRRMARELHDRTSPTLAAISINLELAAMSVRERNWQEIDERIGDTRALIDDTSIGIREICADLRPAALDYAGLVSALETCIAQFSRRTGIQVKAKLEQMNSRLPSDLESALFRIAQEALTNISKHANATLVAIVLKCSGNSMILEVIDNGRGFDTEKRNGVSGLGVINMREIAEFSGGSFSVSSEKGRGTKVRVQFDCEERAA
jgi:PAS domain S-box-containing protein